MIFSNKEVFNYCDCLIMIQHILKLKGICKIKIFIKASSKKFKSEEVIVETMRESRESIVYA